MMTATLGDVALACRPEDFTVFEPPLGQTCAAYAASFLATATGYLGNPDATSACEYCSSSTGLDYVRSSTPLFIAKRRVANLEPHLSLQVEQMGYRWDRRWSDWAILWIFCLSNVFFIYAVTWCAFLLPGTDSTHR